MRFPYRNVLHRTTHGEVLVNFERGPGGPAFRVFLDDIPVGLVDSRVAVYIDRNRFDPSPDLDERDLATIIDIDSHTAELMVGSSGGWLPRDPPAGLAFAVGECTDGARLPLRLCDVELTIPLDVAEEAYGFAVGDRDFDGGFPFSLAAPGTMIDRSLDRAQYQTLLIKEPEGIEFSLVSWNMRRFTPFMQTLQEDPFAGVSILDHAAFLYKHDIIAVQELWSREQASALWEQMNTLRSLEEPPLPPLDMYGPVGFSNQALQDITAAADELHAGLFIFSHFREIDGNFEQFDKCRGEDCLSAKGVQWVRLALSDPADYEAGCIPSHPDEPLDPAGCPSPPSFEEFIDVFNTHLQATGDEVCDNESIWVDLGNAFTGGWFEEVTTNAFFCHTSTPSQVRASQLDEIRLMMDRVLASNPARQALLVGDFNTDGQHLNYGNPSNVYGDMLSRLGLVVGSPTIDAPDDSLYALPEPIGWDLDHADLAREDPNLVCTWDLSGASTESCTWSPGVGEYGVHGTGTAIGSSSAESCTSAPSTDLRCRDNDSVPDGRGRIDYIFVRSGPAEDLDYLLARVDGRPVYESPWPELGDPTTLGYGGPDAGRLSDHKPLVANLKLVSLRQPPPFYTDVPHQFRFTVTSVNGGQESDCIGGLCDPLDLVGYMEGESSTDTINFTPFPPVGVGSDFFSSVCSRSSASRAQHECMLDWTVTQVQQPGVHTHHWGAVRLFDGDGTSPDDQYPTTTTGDHPLMRVDWGTREVEARGIRFDDWLAQWPIVTALPIRWCTKRDPVKMCVEVSFDELDP